MSQPVKVTCSRCGGKGTVAHRTARHDARCFCCGGQGFYYRAARKRRQTAADHIAELNARTMAAYPHLYAADGSLIRSDSPTP